MNSAGLSKEAILKALQDLSDALSREKVKGELCLFGGTVMVLAFSARVATKDVDAIFHPANLIRKLASEIGAANHLPDNWLTRLTMPTPEYLLAMKCMASRIEVTEPGSGDVGDIVFLIKHLKLKSPKEVMNIVVSYYPPNQIPIKAQYLVESLFEEGKI